MTRDERERMIDQRIEWAQQKLRNIKRLARKGGLVGDYHYDELREIIDSLRHHTEQQNRRIDAE